MKVTEWFLLPAIFGILAALGIASSIQFTESEPPSSEILRQGAKIYDANCRQCHLGGNTPIKRLNLVDAQWRHGSGSLEDLVKVVTDGVEATQMEPFKGLLSEEEIRKVCLYVLSLANSEELRLKPTGQAFGRTW